MSPVQLPPQKKLEGSFLKRNWWIFIVIVVVGVIATGAWYVYSRVKAIKRFYSEKSFVDTDSNVADDTTSAIAHFTHRFEERPSVQVDTATLNINGGGAMFNLGDSTNSLFLAETSGGRFRLWQRYSVKSCTLNFWSKFTRNGNSEKSVAELRLNPAPIWNINVNTGAVDLNFDLSKFKVKSMKLEGGANEFKVKLGQPLEETNVNIETGAAEIVLQVPSKAACRIHVNSMLSSNTFDGFEKKGDGIYETSGFAAAKNKIYIEMSGGISDFKVNKY